MLNIYSLFLICFMENAGNPGAWGSEEDQRIETEQKNANVSVIQKDAHLFFHTPADKSKSRLLFKPR